MVDRYDLDIPAYGRSPFQGGSALPYSESTVAWSMFGAHPLQGFTDQDGRYTQATYGSWFPFSKGSVRGFPDPLSEFPQWAAQLESLRTEFGVDSGLPPEAQASQVEPASLVSSISLVDKARKAVARGRMDAAGRITEQLASMHGEAPIVVQLRREVEGLQ